ncbi:hypothetical protein [Nostoc commune]|uniref:hypothetical protein n=1 Tax=Nostoc commune TaxID=1178 RepID=UPI0018C7B2DE|nr:hypothetical protein [Nostoc commune]
MYDTKVQLFEMFGVGKYTPRKRKVVLSLGGRSLRIVSKLRSHILHATFKHTL